MIKQLRLSLLTMLALMISISLGFAVVTIETVAQEKDGLELVQTQLSIDDILNKDRKQIEKKIGKKLKLKERIALKVMKKRMKRALKKGKSKKQVKQALARGDFQFHVGGFFLGFLLGLIGVLIAYIFMEKPAIKSAWLGLGVVLVLVLLGAIL